MSLTDLLLRRVKVSNEMKMSWFNKLHYNCLWDGWACWSPHSYEIY